MRIEIDADTEAVNELATEPASNKSETDRDDPKNDCEGCRRIWIASSQPPTHGENDYHNVHHDSVKEPNPLCSGAVIEREPVGESENGGDESTQHSSRNQPVGNVRPLRAAMHKIYDIACDRCWQQAERKHDQHRMNGMAKKIDFASHNNASLSNSAAAERADCLNDYGSALLQ